MMKIFGLNIKKEYELHYRIPNEGSFTSHSDYFTEPTDNKEVFIPVIEHRKLNGGTNFKIITRIIVEF